MAILTNKIEVSTTAVKLIDVDNVSRDIRLHAKGATYIGAGSVTSTSGFLLDNGDKLDLRMAEGEQLWAVAAAGTHDVYVFVSKID